jgi:hypothetical protein
VADDPTNKKLLHSQPPYLGPTAHLLLWGIFCPMLNPVTLRSFDSSVRNKSSVAGTTRRHADIAGVFNFSICLCLALEVYISVGFQDGRMKKLSLRQIFSCVIPFIAGRVGPPYPAS